MPVVLSYWAGAVESAFQREGGPVRRVVSPPPGEGLNISTISSHVLFLSVQSRTTVFPRPIFSIKAPFSSNVGASRITCAIFLGGPDYNYSIIGTKTLF